MCRPYDRNGEYFYPARRQATYFFTMVVLVFHYVLNPMGHNVWLYTKLWGILYYPLCFTLIFQRYFRRLKLKSNMRKPIWFGIIFGIIFVMLAMSMIARGNSLTGFEPYLSIAVGSLSLIMTGFYIYEAIWVNKKIRQFHLDNYSNDEDFPYKFAGKVLLFPVVWIAWVWIILITDSRWVKFGFDIVCGVWMVLFLTTILHPKYKLTVEKEEEMNTLITEKLAEAEESIADLDAFEEATVDVDDDALESVRAEVISLLIENFKDSHLLKADLLRNISRGNRTLADNFIKKYGFYTLVNSFRLRYFEMLRSSSSDFTIDAMAKASGFSSRYVYYKVAKSLKVDPELVKDVTL